jgi:hypothetical protein
MTMIGTVKCSEGIVLLADGQETITDYAKWSVNKIKSAELIGQFRCVMTGAGSADTIDMIWERVSELWHSAGSSYLHGWISGVEIRSVQQWREEIVSIVREATETCIIPWGNSHSGVSLIWLIQDLSGPSTQTGTMPIELFRTRGLDANNIRDFHFDGNPVLLARYLSDLYLKHYLWGIEEARAFAAYLLWEAKEYDPTVGKQSDIVTFKNDGSAFRMSYEELSYWEDHFRVLKREMSVLPLLSCATTIGKQLYNVDDRMERLNIAIKTLAAEQEQMRMGKRKSSRIDTILSPRLRKHAQRSEEKKAKKLGLMPVSS